MKTRVPLGQLHHKLFAACPSCVRSTSRRRRQTGRRRLRLIARAPALLNHTTLLCDRSRVDHRRDRVQAARTDAAVAGRSHRWWRPRSQRFCGGRSMTRADPLAAARAAWRTLALAGAGKRELAHRRVESDDDAIVRDGLGSRCPAKPSLLKSASGMKKRRCQALRRRKILIAFERRVAYPERHGITAHCRGGPGTSRGCRSSFRSTS